jgi:hypothetical protein
MVTGDHMETRSEFAGKTKHIKPYLIPALLLIVCLQTGCIHAPASYRPNSWVHTPIDMKSVADPPNQSLLQVIIVYGPAWDHHSALRLVCPGRPVLFWDPGGGYGIDLPEVVRSKDLIKVNPPDLQTYIQHIWHFSSIEVEIFEWDLKPEHAHELYDVLLIGSDKNHSAGRFTTSTIGLFCTVAVSNFLHRFAGKTMTVPKTFFFPHSLARVLYTQSPKRVLAFRRHKQTVYFPPGVTSGDFHSSHILR